MKVLFDTSVLIAAMLDDHKFHGPAVLWLSRAKQGGFEFLVSGHSLAETYAVLTRLPRTPMISPDEARRLLHENIFAHATLISLGKGDYVTLIDDLAQLGLTGGVVYDALIAKAADLSGVDHLLTLNVGDFHRAWPSGGGRITSPVSLNPPGS